MISEHEEEAVTRIHDEEDRFASMGHEAMEKCTRIVDGIETDRGPVKRRRYTDALP